VMATLFFASSLTLAYLNSNRQPTASLMDVTVEVEEEVAGSATGEEIDFDLPPMPEATELAGEDDSLPVAPE